jgi:hypothetical protein
MDQEISERDVERIASRVVAKLLIYALVVIAAIWLAPMLFFALLSATAGMTRGLPLPMAVAITASTLAVPVVALIWTWGRRRTR